MAESGPNPGSVDLAPVGLTTLLHCPFFFFFPTKVFVYSFFLFISFQFYCDIVDLQRCINLSVQHNDLTCTHHEMIRTLNLVNIHHLL